MNQTFIIYTIVAFLPIVSSLLYFKVYGRLVNVKITNIILCTPILIISLIYGARYDVGTDWYNYVEIFDFSRTMSYSDILMFNSKIEPLYLCLNKLVFDTLGSYQALFFLLTFAQLTLVMKVISYYKLPVRPLFFILFFTGSYILLTLNIQRQATAMAIFLYSIRFIDQRSPIKYLFTILVAVGFHYSALILLPIYFINSKFLDFMDSRLILLLIYLVSFYLGDLLIEIIQFIFKDFSGKYAKTTSLLGEAESVVSSGYGILYKKLLNLIIILFSSKLLNYFSKTTFKTIFRIYIIGILLVNIVGVESFLIRLPYYFTALEFLILGFLVYYFWQKKRNNTVFYLVLSVCLIVFNILIFYVSIFNGSNGCNPFQFTKYK